MSRAVNVDIYAEGTAKLAALDPVIARLVKETGPVMFTAPNDSNFEALVRAVTYQQLAGPAARAIYGRLRTLVHDSVTEESIGALSPDELRSAGLSHAKAASVLDLAAKSLDGTVPLGGAALASLDDESVIANLTKVRGIGAWTAEIFAMIHLGRLDILPVGDLGIRHGFGLAWGIPTPTPKELEERGERYRPYRSVLAWYCWRAAEIHGNSTAGDVAVSTS